MKDNKVFILSGILALILVGVTVYKLKDSSFYIKFDTDGGSEIETKMVSKGDKVEKPEDPIKEGYIFVEWELDGKLYDFSSKVNKNITLKAKWLPEIYVNVIFLDDGNEIDSIEILSGTKISKDSILTPTKEGYTFAGWYIGDVKYDYSKKVTSNLTLRAKWIEGENTEIPEDIEKENVEKEPKKESTENISKKSEKEDTKKTEDSKSSSKNEFKVGDKVVITGSYAISYDGEIDGYDTAIGWEREIIAVYENEEYPYQVGDSTGTTGFFKAENLQLKD